MGRIKSSFIVVCLGVGIASLTGLFLYKSYANKVSKKGKSDSSSKQSDKREVPKSELNQARGGTEMVSQAKGVGEGNETETKMLAEMAKVDLTSTADETTQTEIDYWKDDACKKYHKFDVKGEIQTGVFIENENLDLLSWVQEKTRAESEELREACDKDRSFDTRTGREASIISKSGFLERESNVTIVKGKREDVKACEKDRRNFDTITETEAGIIRESAHLERGSNVTIVNGEREDMKEACEKGRNLGTITETEAGTVSESKHLERESNVTLVKGERKDLKEACEKDQILYKITEKEEADRVSESKHREQKSHVKTIRESEHLRVACEKNQDVDTVTDRETEAGMVSTSEHLELPSKVKTVKGESEDLIKACQKDQDVGTVTDHETEAERPSKVKTAKGESEDSIKACEKDHDVDKITGAQASMVSTSGYQKRHNNEKAESKNLSNARNEDSTLDTTRVTKSPTNTSPKKRGGYRRGDYWIPS